MTNPHHQQPTNSTPGFTLSPGDQLVLDMSRAIAAGMAEMDRVEEERAAAAREQEVLTGQKETAVPTKATAVS